jgi:rhamnosyltransferase
MCREAQNQKITPAPNADNIALVLVTYYPDFQVKAAVKVAVSQFSQVIVVDNTPDPELVRHLVQGLGVSLLSNGVNVGLGKALNQGCHAAIAAQFEWVVTLDQDSLMQMDFLQCQVSCWAAAADKPFMLGCNFLNRGKGAMSPRFPIGRRYQECKTVITAGALMHLGVWRELGSFREDFFIDSLDHELCLRARGKGFRVARNGEILMSHSIGSGKQLRSWLPFEHSSRRKYTSTRNTVRTILEYGLREPSWAFKKIAGIFYEAIAVLLLEPHKAEKLKAMGVGLADGIRNRLGPPSARFDRV